MTSLLDLVADALGEWAVPLEALRLPRRLPWMW